MPEGYLLKPSIRQCQQRLGWRPDIVVGDLGYIHQQTKQEIRQQWNVAVVTKLKCDMRIIEPFDAWDQMSCQQGQALQWLGYEKTDSLHWFGVPAGESLRSSNARAWSGVGVAVISKAARATQFCGSDTVQVNTGGTKK